MSDCPDYPNIMKSASSRSELGILDKMVEWFSHFKMRVAGRNSDDIFQRVANDIRCYESIAEKHLSRPLRQGLILEIGYGARPLRMFYLEAMGYDVRGVDMDRPVLNGSFSEFVDIYRKNGAERLIKSLVRYFFFDIFERRRFSSFVALRGGKWKVEKERYLVGDVSSERIAGHVPGNLSLIFSEDVFEHIDRNGIEMLCARLQSKLAHDGICIIRLNLFTGITGGHLVEWYPHVLGAAVRRRSEPWEHLRQRRYLANTYLNELRRHEYREIFGRYFEIVEEVVTDPELGVPFMTPEIRAELAEYSDDELFADHILFVLRRK